MADRTDDNGRQQFTPGASFTDDVPEDVALSELPPWLQSFASAVDGADDGETAPDSPAAQPPVAPPPDGGDDPAMPGWLSGPRDDTQQGGTLSSPGGSSFFSEDDLPEWLRALSTEPMADMAMPDSELVEASLDELSATPAIQVLTAPAVSNVWVTGMEEHVENPAAALFSVIATSGNSRPELAMAAAPRVGQSKGGRTDTPSTSAEPEGRRRSSWSRRERILLIAVIVMMLLLLVVLNMNFGG